MQNAVLPSLRPLFMLAASTLVLAAQEKPAAPEKLKPVVVKGTALGGEGTAVSPTLILSGPALEALPQSNIGDLLADLPGVASSYFGPNSGRPVIRGLDGDRLKITQNGVNSLDASAVSPDHAVSVDPLAIREALLSVRQRRLHLRLRHPVRIRMEPILPAGGQGVIELVTLLRKHRLLLHLEVFQPVLSLLLLLQCEALGGLGGLRA